MVNNYWCMENNDINVMLIMKLQRMKLQRWSSTKMKLQRMKLKRLELHRMKLHRMKLHRIKLQRMELQRTKLQILELRRMKLQRMKLKRLELHRMKLHRMKLHRIKLQRMELQRTKLQILELRRMKLQRMKLKRLELHRMKLHRMKLHRIKLQRMELHRTKHQILELRRMKLLRIKIQRMEIQRMKLYRMQLHSYCTDGGLSWQSAWSGPRTIIIPPKTDQGYGFTLHHFIVYPPEFVISQERFQQEDTGIDENDPHGHLYKRPKLRGHEPMETIFVKYVKEGSISHKAGLNTGDRILSVNDVPVTGKSYAQVIGLIKSSENSLLKLDILPKDEDILQMAYKGTTGSLMQDSAQSSHSRSSSSNSGSSGSVSHLRIKGQSAYNPVSLTTDNAPLYGGRVGRYSRDRERRLSASSVDELADAAEQRYLYTSENRNRKMKSSTSYTSGLSIYPRDTAPRNNNGTNGAEYFKHQFMDKRRQFEIRCKENQDTSGPNTYSSLGLFYPSSPSRKENKTASSENVTSSVYRRPRDNVLHSNDSQENISRSGSRPQGRIIPLEHRSPSREGQLYQSQDKMNIGSSLGYSPSSASSSSSSRHSYPDSSAALSVQSSSTLPHSYTSQSSIPSENLKSEHHLTRHYVPVVSSSASPKMSASVDNLDSRNPHYTPERNLRSNFNTHFYEKPNQNCGPRTFIVEIGNKTIEAGGSGNLSTGQPSSTTTVQLPNYGTAFALTKSPMATQIEVKKNNDTVLNRKKQFENGQTDSLQTAPNYNRYKTEIRKITSQGKFTSVANRLENYAKATDGKVQIRRMSSTERYSSPEPSSSGGQSERSTPQPQQPPYQDSAPIRIYVSQGTPNAPASPIVEILPMSVYQDQNQITSQPQGEVTMAKPSVHLQGDVVDGRMISDMDSLCEESVMSKPVLRKPSFLAAVNSQNRYSASHEHEMQCPDSPPTSSWMGSHTSVNSQNTIISFSSMNSGIMPPSSDEGLALTSTPIKDSTISPVILRKKSDSTPDEDAIKLQRRTSYLMATAKDRDSHKLSLDKSVSPNQSVTEFQGSPFNLTPPKQLSMKKLKSFFGEKTPRILEATEKRQDPASPIQEVAKEGTLYCKTDKVDGKRSSDRSWRPVWVELRGHALYLHKDKKEPGTHHPFSFDDQPISIKSSIVDIAYDYSQKKTVKKNVFRLKIYNGSEYLFQTEDHESMMSWIQAIQNNNNPDSDEYGLGSADLIIRKTSQYSESQPQGPPAPTQKTSPQALPKATKKLTGISLKSKIPHSPSLKRKKTESKDDTAKPKTFKGKFKILRKHQLGSSGTANSDEAEVTGMFGVPLQCCIPSPNNDFVPMIVDLCTKIVEARGLEVTGVYRVPGNTAAVHMMQEELNKGIDNMNVDHDKWCDVNVISSLLKAFFRNLPDPLITSELYQKVINSYRLEDPEKRMLKLKFLLHELPEHHFETFKHMAEHLNKVASYGHINKMDSKNLALMFGPTLIRQNDDDMATIVKDMSDQCRIVESIILHHDWYFASWDQDSYVPVDEQTEEIQHPTNPSVSKMSCDDDDNTVNPKEIVSSIVQAANRKLRGKGMDEVDSSLPLTTYKEKDIDKEIAKHNRMKAQAETARSSPNLITVSSSSQDQPMVKVVTRKSENSSDRRMAKSQEIIDTGWDFMDPDRQSQSMYINTRHFSSDSLDKNDDLELSSHGTLSGTYSVSRDTIDRLRKIEEEARLLREKEEKRQRDFQRRKIERQKLEQDIQRTKKEIEIEDSQNVDDLLNAPGHMWHSSAELYRYGGGSTRTDTPSVTSDYSSLSSITADNHTQSRHKYIGSSIPDFSSTNPSPYSLVNLQKSRSREASSQDQKPGGKYFVIQSVSSSKHSNGGNEVSSVMHSSKSSETPPTKPRNSVERILDVANEERLPQTARVVGKRKERQRRTMRDSSEHLRHSRGSLNRSNSMRRGSLDSLIDLYDRHDGRISTVSSDSEDGSDLLSDLTSTFDQKLQVLVNPKYKLNGSATKLNKSDGSASVEQNAHMKLPPQLPLSHCNKHGLCSSNDMLEKQYRDPSLHRSPSTKGETKIGIAYRFERNPSNNALGSNSSRESLSSLHSGSVSTTPAIATEPRTSYMVVNPSPVTLFDPRQKSFGFMTSSPLSLTHSSTLKTDLSVSNNGKDNRPISKSEKTEVNVTLSKQVRDGHSSTDKSKGLLRTFDLEKARSTSPEHEVVKRKGQRSKRRHTVGSTNEVEHFRALAALCQPKSENRKSAWEQLQPVVKDTNTSANKDMLSWLRNERLRGSVPDLSTAADSHVKFS